MVDLIKLTMLYIVFAIIATVFNILAQKFFSYIYVGPLYIFVSMFFGTLIGLIVKYILDKKYIFKYKTKDVKHNGKIFLLYSVMGVFTTLVFWGFELSFYYLFVDKEMRYVGGVIGLMIGYICKFYLDKKFVFRI